MMSILLKPSCQMWKGFNYFIDNVRGIGNAQCTPFSFLKTGLIVAQKVAVYKGTELVFETWKKKVKTKWLLDESKGIEGVFECLLKIAFCYKMVRLCDKVLGLSPKQGVTHLCMTADLLFYNPNSQKKLDGIFSFCLIHVAFFFIHSTFFSTLSPLILFKKALLFSGIYTLTHCYLQSLFPKIDAQKIGLLNPKHKIVSFNFYLFFRLFFIIAEIVLSALICNGFLKLNIPKFQYNLHLIFSMIGFTLFGQPCLYIKYIKHTIFNPDSMRKLKELVPNLPSESQAVARYLIRIGETFASSPEPSDLYSLPPKLNQAMKKFDNIERDFLHFSKKKFSEHFFDKEKQGLPIEERLLRCLSIQLHFPSSIPTETVYNFTFYELLESASQAIKEMCENRDGEIFSFLTAKAIAIYIIGDRQQQDLPKFFSTPTRKTIEELRIKLQGDGKSRNAYQAALSHLEACTINEIFKKEEDVFAMDTLPPGMKKDCLNHLREIASLEMQHPLSFIKRNDFKKAMDNCYFH